MLPCWLRGQLLRSSCARVCRSCGTRTAVAASAMASWTTPQVRPLLCVSGGWCAKKIPIPDADVKRISLPGLEEVTFVHVTMQKRWLLQVCSLHARPTAGQLKGSNAWPDLKRAWTQAGGAGFAEDANESDQEDNDDDPMASLLRGRTPEKQTPEKRTPRKGDQSPASKRRLPLGTGQGGGAS